MLWTLGELVVFLAVKFGGDLYFIGPSGAQTPGFYQLVFWDLHRSLYFIGMSTLLWAGQRIGLFRRQALEAEKRQIAADRDRVQMEIRLVEAQSAYYQHQLNPHLLFNALNFVYNAVVQHSQEAAPGIVRLSEILRFSLRGEDGNRLVPLEEEIAQLRNLQELNRLRFGNRMSVNFTVTGETGEWTIIPLVLLTLAENLYKHGLVIDPENPAQLKLSVDEDGTLHFSVENLKKNSDQVAGAGGLGMRNTMIRLQNTYPGRHNLEISETDTRYFLDLTINL